MKLETKTRYWLNSAISKHSSPAVTLKSYLEYSECGLQSPSEPAVLTECGISLQDSDPSTAKSNQTIRK